MIEGVKGLSRAATHVISTGRIDVIEP
jgi:hypothetical protein